MTIKKIFRPLFIPIFLALTFSFSTPTVHAQSFSTEQQATLDSLKQQLINLLIAQIAMLQAQIQQIIADQANQSTRLGAVQSQVNTVVEQTKPVVIVPTPSPAASPTPPPPIDKRNSCGNLKVSQWEQWTESDLGEPRKEVNGSVTNVQLFQGGGHDGEHLLYCPSVWDDSSFRLPNGTSYKTYGCQKFLAENPEWLACMVE